ncbi:SIMPL domain-containing protein [Ornithinibacillus californiensis]|uniref:SIMPL domain-containing protein n=1 Tax=Ornithinibacillus californiensis TaxID=161536 RepID=UPI00064D775C|nr:SIMPL domain-containing protein [Ornithinibacillus californiensis]
MYYQANPYFRNAYPTRQNNNLLKVYGEGSVLAQPDQATVVLGVITENKDLQTAQQTNATQTRNVINAIVNSGVPRENIQTTEFRVNIQYDFQNGTQVFRGYQVTNLLTVQIDEIEKVGEIVDIAVDNGANTVRNIELTVSDKNPYYNQALTNAIQNAQDKATTMAQTLGVSINQVPIRLKEITSMAPEPPRPFVLGVSTESAATTPIEAGQLEIKAQVEAEFTY